jgi:hemolysin-activating ACP:hemolysin acyltransferase
MQTHTSQPILLLNWKQATAKIRTEFLKNDKKLAQEIKWNNIENWCIITINNHVKKGEAK